MPAPLEATGTRQARSRRARPVDDTHTSCPMVAEPATSAATPSADEGRCKMPCEKHIELAVELSKVQATLEAQGKALDRIHEDVAEQRETVVATLRCVTELQSNIIKAVDDRLAPFRDAEATLKLLKWGVGGIGTIVVALGIDFLKKMLEL